MERMVSYGGLDGGATQPVVAMIYDMIPLLIPLLWRVFRCCVSFSGVFSSIVSPSTVGNNAKNC